MSTTILYAAYMDGYVPSEKGMAQIDAVLLQGGLEGKH